MVRPEVKRRSAAGLKCAGRQGVHVIAVKLYALGGRLYEMLSETRVEDRNDPTVVAFMNSLQVIR